MRKARLKSESGMTLIEVLFAIAIFTALIGPLTYWVREGNIKAAQKTAATQMILLADSVSDYVKANYASLIASATASVPTELTLATLQTGGFLPSTFQSMNPWRQTYRVFVNEPAVGKLRAVIITTGGRGHVTTQPDFGNRIIPAVAAAMGAAGGFMPSGDIPGTTAGTLQGAFGGWKLNLTGTGIPNPGAGRLAYLMDFNDGDISKDSLYRVNVPGQPELNQMFTTLDMNGNNIIMGDANVGGGDGEGVRSINFEQHVSADFTCAAGDNTGGTLYYDDSYGLFICRQGVKRLISDTGNSRPFRDAMIANHGDYITKPICPAGTSTPQIFTTPAMVSDGGTGYPLQSIETWAGNSGASWRVYMRVQTREGYRYPNATYGKILVMTRCI